MLARERGGYRSIMVTYIIIMSLEERGEKDVGNVNIEPEVEVGGG